jgi:predicted transcriptional regulator
MEIPQRLLEQLLALSERERLEIAQALLDSVDSISETDRAWLHRAIERSMEEIDAGQTTSLEEVLAWLRAKRTTHVSG